MSEIVRAFADVTVMKPAARVAAPTVRRARNAEVPLQAHRTVFDGEFIYHVFT